MEREWPQAPGAWSCQGAPESPVAPHGSLGAAGVSTRLWWSGCLVGGSESAQGKMETGL